MNDFGSCLPASPGWHKVFLPHNAELDFRAGQTRSTAPEVQFFFGQILAPMVGEQPKEIISNQMFGVAITLDHAKRVLALLDRQIKLTEKIMAQQQAEETKQKK